MTSRITIAGDIGSGKTTVARRLAGMIGVDPLSIGSLQRQLAQARGVDTLELNQLAETDMGIDREIDGHFKGLSHGDLVAEARLAWHFIPDTLKVFLYISDFEAVRRVIGAKRADENYDPALAVEKIFARRLSEVERFKRYYDVDIDRLSNYDLVIDTTFSSVDEIVKKIFKHLHVEGRSKDSLCHLCPRNLVPTHGIRELQVDRVKRIEDDIIARGFNVIEPISVLYVDHVFYIVDGHARVGAAIGDKLTFVPAVIRAHDDEPYEGRTARQHVQESVTDARVYDWEEAMGFRFQDLIWKGRAYARAAG
jgi:CMP/dCMP kinase